MTCRGALLADQAALEQWKTSSPLLIMGSHRWNIPNSRGQIACGGERQAKLLQAVRYRYKQLSGLLVVAKHDFLFIQPIKTILRPLSAQTWALQVDCKVIHVSFIHSTLSCLRGQLCTALSSFLHKHLTHNFSPHVRRIVLGFPNFTKC